jgi:hypothetical protein
VNHAESLPCSHRRSISTFATDTVRHSVIFDDLSKSELQALEDAQLDGDRHSAIVLGYCCL